MSAEGAGKMHLRQREISVKSPINLGHKKRNKYRSSGDDRILNRHHLFFFSSFLFHQVLGRDHFIKDHPWFTEQFLDQEHKTEMIRGVRKVEPKGGTRAR